MVALLHKKSAQIIFTAFFTFFALIVFYDLEKAPLENWDETFYGEAIKQMIKTKEFIVLQFNGGQFLEKPPLQMWISAFISMFTRLNEFMIRFPSALGELLTVAITIYYAYRQFGFVPALFSFSTLALNNIFISRKELVEEVKARRMQWVVGKTPDVEEFMKNFPEKSYTIEKHNDEVIFHKVKS